MRKRDCGKPLAYDPNVGQFLHRAVCLINDENDGSARTRHDDCCGRWSNSHPFPAVEIRHCKRKVSWLKHDTDEHERFMRALLGALTSVNVVGVAYVIDRRAFNARHREKYRRRMWQ
ncbi:MAG TPA: hypothetical protein VND80_06390 [Steroidobacteraceae bacterium]|nr:hypothetical protein [Steroidobacteraceae bacterium]